MLCDTEVRRVPAGIPGVYLLHTFDARRGWYIPIYVGKTCGLRERLAEHMDSSSSADVRLLRLMIQIYFSAARIPDATERDRIEAGLIRLLRPTFNRQVPRGPAVYTNLPPMVLSF